MNVHRVVLTVIDFDGIGAESVRDVIENAMYPNRCIAPTVESVETRDCGEWSDDHPLNQSGSVCAEAIKELFGENP